MYLEGELERGIVPDESVWMQGGGEGEDGCLLLLRKMNLELLRQCTQPSDPRAAAPVHKPLTLALDCASSKPGIGSWMEQGDCVLLQCVSTGSQNGQIELPCS